MAGLIARHAPAEAIVVSLQNGVGNADVLRAHARARAQRAVGGHGAFQRGADAREEGERPRFHRATSGTMLIAAGVAGLREVLDVPGAAVAEHADMAGVLWGKLLLNLNNALNALSDLPLAKELADRRWRLLLAAQIEEALAVLKAADVRPARIEGVPPRAIPFDPASARLCCSGWWRAACWPSIRKRARPCGRTCGCAAPTEIDHLQGAILALADKAGVAAPLTERVLRLIKGAESAGAGSPGCGPEQVASVR